MALSSSAARLRDAASGYNPAVAASALPAHLQRHGADWEQQLVPSEVRREKGSRAIQLVVELAVRAVPAEAVPAETGAGSAMAAFRS